MNILGGERVIGMAPCSLAKGKSSVGHGVPTETSSPCCQTA